MDVHVFELVLKVELEVKVAVPKNLVEGSHAKLLIGIKILR